VLLQATRRKLDSRFLPNRLRRSLIIFYLFVSGLNAKVLHF